MSHTAVTFIVKNITSPARIVKVFNTQIYPGKSLDIMKIPGVTEADVRYSLLTGDLKNRINYRQLEVTTSPITLTSHISMDILNIVGPANLIRPLPIVPGIVKTLTDNVAKELFQIDLSQTYDPPETIPNYSFAGKIAFAVECGDGDDVQARQGDLNVAAVLKRSTGIITTTQTQLAFNAVTSGSLSTTFTWTTSGNIATLSVTANSSLTTPTIFIIHYFLLHGTHRAPAFAFL